MHIIKTLIELFGKIENFLTDAIRHPVPWSASRVPMDDSFDSFDSNRSPNSFGLPVGHTYFLGSLPQGDLSSLHQTHYMPPL
jgi:hypothetical protein